MSILGVIYGEMRECGAEGVMRGYEPMRKGFSSHHGVILALFVGI